MALPRQHEEGRGGDQMTNLGVTPPIVLPLRLSSLADANVTLSTSCLLFAVYGVLHFTGWILPKQQLSKQERGEWNVRAVSTVNALVISLGIAPRAVSIFADCRAYSR